MMRDRVAGGRTQTAPSCKVRIHHYGGLAFLWHGDHKAGTTKLRGAAGWSKKLRLRAIHWLTLEERRSQRLERRRLPSRASPVCGTAGQEVGARSGLACRVQAGRIQSVGGRLWAPADMS